MLVNPITNIANFITVYCSWKCYNNCSLPSHFQLVTVTALEQMILCFVIPLVVYAAVMWEWAGGSVSSARMATLISAKMDVKVCIAMLTVHPFFFCCANY